MSKRENVHLAVCASSLGALASTVHNIHSPVPSAFASHQNSQSQQAKRWTSPQTMYCCCSHRWSCIASAPCGSGGSMAQATHLRWPAPAAIAVTAFPLSPPLQSRGRRPRLMQQRTPRIKSGCWRRLVAAVGFDGICMFAERDHSDDVTLAYSLVLLLGTTTAVICTTISTFCSSACSFFLEENMEMAFRVVSPVPWVANGALHAAAFLSFLCAAPRFPAEQLACIQVVHWLRCCFFDLFFGVYTPLRTCCVRSCCGAGGHTPDSITINKQRAENSSEN